MYYLNEFKRIRDSLCKRREMLTGEITSLPAGELYCYQSHGSQCYAERLPAAGNIKKERRIGINRNTDRLNKLVRKKYVTEAVRLLDQDIKAIDSLLRRYKPSDENSVMAEFVDKYPELIDGIYYGKMNYQKWAADYKPVSSFHEENLKSVSARGGRRRSLGEIVIGSRLDYYHIPYRYEAPLSHPDLRGKFSPDFTIIRPSDGKVIYWEHLGMVSDKEYMNYNKYKLSEYEKHGIVPWDNLIISYSQDNFGINEKLIDGLIHGWLL